MGRRATRVAPLCRIAAIRTGRCGRRRRAYAPRPFRGPLVPMIRSTSWVSRDAARHIGTRLDHETSAWHAVSGPSTYMPTGSACSRRGLGHHGEMGHGLIE
jgi:hypothetical protein